MDSLTGKVICRQLLERPTVSQSVTALGALDGFQQWLHFVFA